MTTEARCVWPARAMLGEGPLWSARDQAVYWVDIKSPAVHGYRLADGTTQSWPMPELIGWVIERRQEPGFIAGFRRGFATLTLEPLAIDFFGSPEPDFPENRLNDAKADAQGRIWAGSMDDRQEQDSGSLYRLNADHSWRRVDRGYRVSNGPTLSPDGHYLYHTDSLKRVIYRFAVTPAGTLTDKQPWVQLPDSNGYPDGMTTDSEGGIWVAIWGGSAVRRYRPDGQFDREIRLPVSQVTSCTFAGPLLDRLFVTTAAVGVEHEPLAGGLFEMETGMRGLPTALFAG